MFKFIASMWWFIKKNWYRYVLVVFFGLVVVVLNLIPSMIIGELSSAIEDGTVTRDYLIYTILIPYLIVVASAYGCSLIKRTFMNRLTTTLYYALHNRYMDSILEQDASFFERYATGDLLTRALGDINTVKFSAGNRLLNIFIETCSVVATFIAMCLIDPLLALCCFIPLSMILLTNLILKRKVTSNWKRVREKASDMGNSVLESITNVRTIRAYSKEEENYNKNLEYSRIVYETEKKNLKVNIIFSPLFQFIVMISTLICYGVGAYFYKIGRITELSDLVKFGIYLALFQSPLTKIGNMINNFYQSMISAERLNEVYNSKSSVVSGEKTLSNFECLEFKGFEFTYDGDSFEALKDINLKLNKGETLGIVGKTGSGKSTLAKMLLRQLPVKENTIFVNDLPISEYEKKNIRLLVSYVPQEHVLFSRSVYENVAFGKENATEDDIMEAISLASFTNDISALNEGLDTIVGEYGVTLSGGQKQRLAIARAFVKNSDILIMDDSLSAVDGTTESNIINSIKKSRNGKTNIIISHRLSAVKHADNIIVLDKGRIIESGTHNELMSKKGWYYTQYISQQMKEVE